MAYDDLPIGDEAPHIVNMVVEIPSGSRNKIEFDRRLGVFRLDRVLYSTVHYPGDYGFVPSTMAQDGDPLDIIAFVTEPTFSGCLLSVRPIGLLEMADEKGRDEKILAVPAHDPRFDEIKDISDLSPHRRREIEYFFEIYKELEHKESAVIGWRGLSAAHRTIRAAQDAASSGR